MSTVHVSSSVSKKAEEYYTGSSPTKASEAGLPVVSSTPFIGSPSPAALNQIAIVGKQKAQLAETAPGSKTPPSPPSTVSISIESGSPSASSPVSETSLSKSTSRPMTPDSTSSAIHSHSASAAYMAGTAQARKAEAQAKKLGEWKVRYGAELVESVVPKSVQEKIWTPIQMESYENFLSWHILHPKKVVDKLLTPEVRAQGLELIERATLYFQIFNLAELVKYKEELEQKLGADKYKFLVAFLSNVNQFIQGIQQDSPKALESFHEITAQHDQFVQVADEAFKQLEASHTELHRNNELWTRLKNGILNFRDNIGIVRDLQEKLQKSTNFWSKLEVELGSENYSKQEVASLVEGYFSRFSEGHLPVQESDLKEIKTLLERRRIGAQISKVCLSALNLDAIYGANRKIEDNGIFLSAQQAQVALDRHLQKLKLLDGYHLQFEKARVEAQLFEALKDESAYQAAVAELKKPEEERPFSKLSDYELQIVKALMKKQKKSGDPIQTIIQSSLSNVRGYSVTLERDILKLTTDLRKDADFRSQNSRKDFIDPKGRGLSLVSNGVNILAIMGESLEFFGADREKFLDSHVLQLQVKESIAGSEAEKRNYRNQIQEIQLRRQSPAADLRSSHKPFFDDYYVFPIGNVLYKNERKPLDGKWAVVDLSGVSSRADKERIVNALKPEFLKGQLDKARPYETLSFDLQLNPLANDKTGPVKIFYETPQGVRDAEDRDFGQRARLVRKGPLTPMQKLKGRTEWPQGEYGDYVRVMKPDEPFLDKGWNPGRERTAAVDSLEAVWMSRLILADILSGNSDWIDWNVLHHTTEYLDVVQGSDLGKIEGSYSENGNFRQAVNQFGNIRQALANLIIERLPLESLRMQEDKRKSDLDIAVKQLSEIRSIVKGWMDAIGTFKKNVPFWRKSDYARYVQEFDKIETVLEEFLKGLPNETANERFILDTLATLERGFTTLSTAFEPLANAEQSPLLKAEKARRLKREKMDFQNAASLAIPNVFQVPARFGTILESVAESVSELSPSNLEVRKTWVSIKGRVYKGELKRSQETKKSLNANGRQGAIDEFFRPRSIVSAAAPRVAIAQTISVPSDGVIGKKVEPYVAPDLDAPFRKAEELAAAGLNVAGQNGVDGSVGQK